MRKFFALSFFVCAVIFASNSCGFAAAISDAQIDRIWKANGSVGGEQDFPHGIVNWRARIVYVEGYGKITSESAKDLLKAKRAAKVDAQRNTLFLLREIKSLKKLSGKVITGKIIHEAVEGKRIRITVELSLKRLLQECVVWK